MSNEIIFHLGTPKTGTTSIQRALRLLREKVGGYIYPEPLQTESHIFEISSLLKECGKNHDMSWFPEFKTLFASHAGYSLSNSLRDWNELNTEGKPLVFSCEFAFDALSNNACLELLSAILKRNGYHPRFLLYLRRVDEHCNSDIVQTLKEGLWKKNGDFQKLLDNRRHDITLWHKNLVSTLSLWLNYFDKACFIIRPFEKLSLYQGDVVRDFFVSCGLADPEDYQDSFQNHSVPYDFLLYFAKLYGGPVERSELSSRLYQAIYSQSDFSSLDIPSSRYCFSPVSRMEMINSVMDAYDWISRNFVSPHGRINLFSSMLPSSSEQWRDLRYGDPARIAEFKKIIADIGHGFTAEGKC